MTKYRQLHCKEGCCRDHLIDVFEQHFIEQDDVMNALGNEHLSLLMYIENEVMPYLQSYAGAGDEWARDLLIDLSTYV